ncbi:MAG: indole-3-glycerol phosphate synthase TrpC [Proteobacteria bacterium]|nr:indole-3-glycerol phosphate synthase TrpC [Pseudomonadota bacterium]
MADTLAKICADKRVHIATRKKTVPLSEVEKQAKVKPKPRGFHAAIKNTIAKGVIALIAEVKKASPSKGVIREDFDPVMIAKSYVAGGATCLSVLTDEPYFQGKDAYLDAVRKAVTLPIIRKDFILDTYQVAEARALGADAILLIMAALSDVEAQELEAAATAYNLDALVEVHDEKELERALKLKSRLIGINNRDLKTLAVDLQTTEKLAKKVPSGTTLVCESGIFTPTDIARMQKVGAHTFLVGESLMREADITVATKRLLGRHA